ncbi:catalase [Rhizoctonia solani AG-1 IA]|uniref:Catalase n=1 Tax=Thanatephorus cucumeris (strain AG1-IA) TaxID=983506 RepID=L8WJQ1_THACA|nr:catalase [Rhizoctonia solani AG-1 IA]
MSSALMISVKITAPCTRRVISYAQASAYRKSSIRERKTYIEKDQERIVKLTHDPRLYTSTNETPKSGWAQMLKRQVPGYHVTRPREPRCKVTNGRIGVVSSGCASGPEVVQPLTSYGLRYELMMFPDQDSFCFTMPSQQVLDNKDGAVYTTSNGAPYPEPYEAQRVGPHGPLLLQDFHHIDLLAHFDRERIPERVVHAKGAGAHGYFEVTHDISNICRAAIFNKVGNRAPVTARFSTVGGESGSADTARDPRGFSIKVRTEEGNWDWVFNNTPVFFIRDPAKFPHFIHTQKRDPQTNLKDADMFWDYLSQNPESIHQVMILFGDRGIPDGYRHQHGYSGHTFKWYNENGDFHYVQVHCRKAGSNGYRQFLTQEKGVELAGSNPDYGTQDLFEAIEKGEPQKWDVFIQTMTPEQAESFRYNILDLTKIWPHKDYPLQPIGTLVLDRNPENYFNEIEQVAFSPSHLVPGVEPSADPVLQSRLFSYPDTHRHRLGVNYQQIPVNAPLCPVANFRESVNCTSRGARPNYQSSLAPLTYKKEGRISKRHEIFEGAAVLDLSELTEREFDHCRLLNYPDLMPVFIVDFEQPRALWQKVMKDDAKERFVKNVAGHLGGAKSAEIKARQLSVFAAVDQDLSDRIAKAMGVPTVKPLQVKPASAALKFKAGCAHTPFCINNAQNVRSH